MSGVLAGRTIVVTRAREMAGQLTSRLAVLGANVIEFPVIKIVDPLDFGPMDRAIERIGEFNWLVFTSVNGVDYFWRRLGLAGKSSADLGHLRICAIGPATAQAVRDQGLEVALMPQKFVAEGILDEVGEVQGQKFLLPRADIAREALIIGLEERGATVEQVTAYRTIVAPDENGQTSAAELVAKLEAGQVDLATFTSSSTVRNFAARLATASPRPLPELLAHTVVACIGPITAGTAREMGLTVGLEASEFTIDRLVETIAEYFGPVPLEALKA